MPDTTEPRVARQPRSYLRRVGCGVVIAALVAGTCWYRSGSPRTILKVGGGAYALAFSPDGTVLAVAGQSAETGTISLWNVSAREPSARWTTGSHEASGLAFDQTGESLTSVTLHWDGTRYHREVKVWDVATRKEKAGPSADFPVRIPVTSPDGRIMVDRAGPGRLVLTDVGTGAELFRLEADPHRVNCAAFSPDGAILATGGGDTSGGGPNPIPGANGDIRIWDVATGRRLVKYNRHWWAPIMAVAFSPDGRIVASGDLDGVVMLWDVPDR